MTTWHILTGEYPPQTGGVSDYTQLVAARLARAGDEVHVYAPHVDGETPEDEGVTVHRLPGVFGPRALAMLDSVLGRARRPFRLLVQFVPHMYGLKAMNLPLCAWLAWQRHARPWVMFHEVAYPLLPGQPIKHRVMALAHRAMASILARTSERFFVAIPAWETLLRRLAPHLPPTTWLPVPSNVTTEATRADALAVRVRWNIPDAEIIGHFGTFGGAVAESLARLLPAMLDAPGRAALLVGRGSEEFARGLLAARPELRGRAFATGALDANQVAAHLLACDVLAQPYPDGVSCRRGSVMAGVALGLAVVTTKGDLTEPIWAEKELVVVVPAGDDGAFVAAVNDLLTGDRRALGERARRGYAEWFSLERTVSAYREAGEPVKRQGPKPRVAFVVNGEPSSAMGQRAAAFARRLKPRFEIQLFHRSGGKLASLAAMARSLFRFRPRVVYVFDMAWSGVGAAMLYRLLPGVKVVVDTGDAITALARSMGRSRAGVALTHALERTSLSFADRIVVRGTYHQEMLRERQIHADFLPDGVEIDLFTPLSPEPPRSGLTVGLVGSSIWSEPLQTCYGWDLVELVRLLKDRPFQAVMVGGGSGVEVLKRRCAEYGIADRVRFMGYVPLEQLPAHLAKMDVCLSTQTNDLPGRVRTTGKLPLYLAAGRYVLASRVGEAARVLPEEMLVDFDGTSDPAYPAKLAERVARLLDNPTLLQRGRDNVALAKANFDYDLLAERLAGILDSLLAER